MKKFMVILAFAAALALLNGCGEEKVVEKGSFSDQRDSKKYATVKIGSQTWMSENLGLLTKYIYWI